MNNSQAIKLADRYLEILAEAKATKDEKDKVVAALRQYVTKNNVEVVGNLMAYRKKTAPKFETTNKSVDLKDAISNLLADCPIDFLKAVAVNVTEMNSRLHDPEVKQLLRDNKLQIVVNSIIHFKHI